VNGLEKLAYAESQVAIMRKDLEELQPQLIVASAETEEMLKTIAIESKDAEVQKKAVSAEEAIANEKAMQAQGLKVSWRCVQLIFFLTLFNLDFLFYFINSL
jgi:dynein heavy chain